MSEQSPMGRVLDIVFRPGRFLASRPEPHGNGVGSQTVVLLRTLLVLVVNLVLYAVPVTVTLGAPILDDPLGAVVFVVYPFLLLTGVTVWAFHAATVVTGTVRGFITSFQTVVSTAGVYLALALGFAFPVLVGEGAVGDFVRGVTLYLFVFNDDTVTAQAPTELAVIAAAVALCYYGYSLYLAARLRHGASRVAAGSIAFVTLGAPVAVYPWLAGDEVVPAVLSTMPVIVLGGVAGVLSVLAIAFDLIWRPHR